MEYAIVRAIGITKTDGLKIFLYQAVSIVLSALVIGFILGYLLQQITEKLFRTIVEQKMVRKFPVDIAIITAFICVCTSYISVRIPIYELNKLSIASVLKG